MNQHKYKQVSKLITGLKSRKGKKPHQVAVQLMQSIHKINRIIKYSYQINKGKSIKHLDSIAAVTKTASKVKRQLVTERREKPLGQRCTQRRQGKQDSKPPSLRRITLECGSIMKGKLISIRK